MDWKSPGKTAVITGGASGIGLAFASVCRASDMNVVIVDRDVETLKSAQQQLEGETGAGQVRAFPCDVSDADAMQKLAGDVFQALGPVHCLMNNAGVASPAGTPWEDVAGARALIDINFWGVANGCAAFIPGMLDHGEPAAVINTGSKQGITKPPGNWAYNVSKASVVAYTESVAHALRQIEGAKLSAHLLVPGFVYTGMVAKFIPQKPPGAWTSEETVAFMVDSIGRGDFYIICPDNDVTREMDEKRIQWAADDLIKNRPALSRWHPDFAEAFEAFMQDDLA